jgi:hypothetical protein
LPTDLLADFLVDRPVQLAWTPMSLTALSL